MMRTHAPAPVPRGITLIEVLIAASLITVSLSALLFAQLRTLQTRHLAEQNRIVARAAANLAEAMRANAVRTSDSHLDYTHYLRDAQSVGANTGSVSLNNGQFSSHDAARAHLAEFEQQLATLPDTAVVAYALCHDSGSQAPTLQGSTLQANCQAAHDSPTVIKVAWAARLPEHSDTPVHTFMLTLPR